jgi:hypothetical protein
MDAERRNGGGPLTTIYMARLSDLYAGRLALRDAPAPQAAPAAAAPPGTPAPPPVPDALRGTVNTPDIAPEGWEVLGRTPFLPAAPEASAAPGKVSDKTVKSMPAVPSTAGDTLPLGAELLVQRPTPSMPFAGSAGGDGALYVPSLDARQYVALRVDLATRPKDAAKILRAYRVPNDAALRALDAHWRHPARRAELREDAELFLGWLRACILGEGP